MSASFVEVWCGRWKVVGVNTKVSVLCLFLNVVIRKGGGMGVTGRGRSRERERGVLEGDGNAWKSIVVLKL